MRSCVSSTSSYATALLAVSFLAFIEGAEAQQAPPQEGRVVLAEGRDYRLVTREAAGGLDIELRDADGNWVPLTRKGGEAGWYGYNKGAAEVRSTSAAPSISREKRDDTAVTVATCTLEPGVVHRACYFSESSFCIVVTELHAEQAPLDEASIIRLAPRFDIDIQRFSCFGLRDGRGILHTGTISAIAARPAYIGTGGWGGPGCVVSGLDPERNYLAFFNPLGGPLVAFVFPRPKILWNGGRHFLQLWEGGANLLYAGMFDRDHFNNPTAFAIYARPDGDLQAFEADLPALLQQVDRLAASGFLQLPALSAAHELDKRLARLRTFLSHMPEGDEGQWMKAWKNHYAVVAATRALTLGNPKAGLSLLDWAQ
jgi:hypothetical protein